MWAGHVALDFNLIGAIRDGFSGRLSRKLLTVVNEIAAAQIRDRYEFAQRIKGMVTDETIEINPKFGRRHLEFLLTRWIIFSNHIAAMPLDDHDRRFCVARNPDTPRDPAYYARLYGLLGEREFIASARRVLAERDIAGFVAGGRAPTTAARARVIDAVRPPLDSALAEIRAHWPGALIRSSGVAELVRHLTGMGEDDPLNSAALTYAYRRCAFVPLCKSSISAGR